MTLPSATIPAPSTPAHKVPLLALFLEDLDTALSRDPAANSRLEVAVSYPGVHALWAHRLANRMWRGGLRTPARMLQQLTRTFTGVDIHPAATLGRRLFIDHATGVVIGETAVVGEDCVIFHGVTLGGQRMTKGKRHPTVGNGVLLGAGAKVLGDITVGSGAKVGANAVVVKDVPEDCVAVGVPAKICPACEKAKAAEWLTEPALFI